METTTILASAESSDSAVTKYHSPKHSFHHSPTQNNDKNGILSLTSILLIVIPIIILILLSFIIVLIILLRRQGSSKSESYNSNSDNSSKFVAHTAISFTESSPEMKNGCMSSASSKRTSQCQYKGVQVFTYKELEMATNNFNEGNVIGHGGYGVVYRGVLGDGTVVAIKMVHRDGKQGERAFKIEVDLLSRLHSPYLMELLGYCADQNHRLLIFEFMPNGSLQQHLHSPHTYPQPLDWGTRLRIALDCARALEFLHEHVIPSIIHRDFKCSNILLDHNFRAKVSDFGLAKTGSNKINGQISTRVLGTTGYLAPEWVCFNREAYHKIRCLQLRGCSSTAHNRTCTSWYKTSTRRACPCLLGSSKVNSQRKGYGNGWPKSKRAILPKGYHSDRCNCCCLCTSRTRLQTFNDWYCAVFNPFGKKPLFCSLNFIQIPHYFRQPKVQKVFFCIENDSCIGLHSF